MNLRELIQAALEADLTTDELRELNNAVVDMINDQVKTENRSPLYYMFSEGDAIRFNANARSMSGETGTVVKKNRTKIVVRMDNGRTYNCPPSILEQV